MAVRVVVQARSSSSRLPAKVLLPIGGMTLAGLVATRAGAAGLPVIVATSTAPDDDYLADLLRADGLTVLRGPLEDPLARFTQATDDMKDSDTVVRLTADNPVPDGDLLEILIARVSADTPYARVGGDDDSMPYGLSAEAFTVSALRSTAAQADRPDHREHVTVWMREHLKENVVTAADLGISRNQASVRCTIDTFEDYIRAARAFSHLADPISASWRDALDAFQKRRQEALQTPTKPADSGRTHQSRLILGTAQFGSAYGATNTIGDLDIAQVKEVLQSARRHGISHLDTARAYQKSELRIGSARREGPISRIGIVTKITPLDSLDPSTTSEDTIAHLHASFFESLTALRTDKVSALLVHRANDWFRPGVREALIQLQHDGRTDAIGASITDPRSLKDLLEDTAVQYIQLPLNLVDHRWAEPDLLRLISSRPDVTITARSAFLQGLLVNYRTGRWPTNFGVSREQLQTVVEGVTARLGRHSPADLAIAYVLGHKWIDSVVVGAESARQVEELVRCSTHSPLSATEIQSVNEEISRMGDIEVDPSRWEFA